MSLVNVGVAPPRRSARLTRQLRPSAPTLFLWCVPYGARVATPAAELPVETLSTGDQLLTSDGTTVPVLGVEHARAMYGAAEAGRTGRPIRIRANALADGVPQRDTTVLADQALRLSDGASLRLVEVIDGANVGRVDPGAIDWMCLALATDLPLLVNGLLVTGFPLVDGSPGESAADTWTDQAWARVAHAAFGGGTVRDFPSGGQWAALRKTLADRARASGVATITDPALHLRLDDGTRLWPRLDGNICRFALPPGLTTAELATRSGVPSRYLGVDDDRKLGIAVSGVRVGRREVPLDHWALRGGWYEPEATWRWTDGAAQILLPHRARELTVTIANPLAAYPL